MMHGKISLQDKVQGAAYVEISETDGHVEWKEGMDSDANMVAFGQAAEAYAVDKNLNPLETIIADDSGEVTFTKSGDNGYYLITSTLGTKAIVETNPVDENKEINEKNPEDTIKKEVQEGNTWGESNDVQIGDVVNFKSTATIQPYTRNVYIHDTMDEGLTFDSSSIKIYTDVALTTELATANYEILATPAAGDTFTIQIKDSYIENLSAAATLTITYSATLNEKAVVTGEDGNVVIDPQTNKTTIAYGDKQSKEDDTKTTTHKFSVLKYVKGDSNKKHLAGAEFKLSIITTSEPETGSGAPTKEYTDVKLIKIDANNYRVAKAGETGAVDTFTTVAEGDIVIWGVDADNYALTEINPPDGYNKLENPIDVKVDAANSTVAEVENATGTQLPSTGGIGTTIFYIIGGCVVLAAVIFLIVRSKKSSAK